MCFFILGAFSAYMFEIFFSDIDTLPSAKPSPTNKAWSSCQRSTRTPSQGKRMNLYYWVLCGYFELNFGVPAACKNRLMFYP